MTVPVKIVCERAMHYLSEEAAQPAGLRLADLLAFVGGTFSPTDEQLESWREGCSLNEHGVEAP